MKVHNEFSYDLHSSPRNMNICEYHTGMKICLVLYNIEQPKKHISVRNQHHEISFLPFQAFRHYKNRLSRKGFRINTINFSLRFLETISTFLDDFKE